MTDDQHRDQITARMAELRALARERDQAIDNLARGEIALRQIIANPGPLVIDGEIIRDDNGDPLPDENVRREAQRVLDESHRRLQD